MNVFSISVVWIFPIYYPTFRLSTNSEWLSVVSPSTTKCDWGLQLHLQTECRSSCCREGTCDSCGRMYASRSGGWGSIPLQAFLRS